MRSIQLHPTSLLIGAGITILATLTMSSMVAPSTSTLDRLHVAGVATGAKLLPPVQGAERCADMSEAEVEEPMQVQYLEIVTSDMEATCSALETLHGVTFEKPEPMLGNARTAELKGGGRIGVRAPMRETEEPVVRPYILVEDIEAAVEAAKTAGAEIAHPPLEIPGQGTFAIYIQGGIQYGLWQN